MQRARRFPISQEKREILKSTQIVHVVFLHFASQHATKRVLHSSHFDTRLVRPYEQAIKASVLITKLRAHLLLPAKLALMSESRTEGYSVRLLDQRSAAASAKGRE